jgi:hypothetical protein
LDREFGIKQNMASHFNRTGGRNRPPSTVITATDIPWDREVDSDWGINFGV